MTSREQCQTIGVTGITATGAATAQEVDVVGQIEKTRGNAGDQLDQLLQRTVKGKDIVDVDDMFESPLFEYLRTLQYYLLIPAVSLVLAILIFPLCTCCHGIAMLDRLAGTRCRYSCFCCCACAPKHSFSRGERRCSVTYYLVVAAITFVCILVGLVGGNTFADVLLKGSCQFDESRIVAQQLISNLTKPADDLVQGIGAMITGVNESQNTAYAKMNYTYPSQGLEAFTNAIDQLQWYAGNVSRCNSPGKAVSSPPDVPPKCGNGNYSTTYTNPTGPLPIVGLPPNENMSCIFCHNPEKLTALSAALTSTLASPATKAKTETDNIKMNLIEVEGKIVRGVDGIKVSLHELYNALKDGGSWATMARYFIDSAYIATQYATIATGSLFGLNILSIILTIIGVCLMSVNHRHSQSDSDNEMKSPDNEMELGLFGRLGGCFVCCGWMSVCCSMIIMLIVCTILWPAIYIAVDTCSVLEKVPNDISKYVPEGLEGRPTEMLQTCFVQEGNKSFIPKELLDNFDFGEQVTFESAELKNTIKSKFDDLPLPALQSLIRNMTHFTRDEINNEPNQYYKQRMVDIMTIKGLMKNVTVAEQHFRHQMVISIDNIDEIMSITSELFEFGDRLKDSKNGFNCLAVGKEYHKFRETIKGILSGMALLTGAMMSVSIIGFLLAYAGQNVNKRCGGHGLPRDFDKGGVKMQELRQMEGQSKPNPVVVQGQFSM
jgi:hypothetical protein